MTLWVCSEGYQWVAKVSRDEPAVPVLSPCAERILLLMGLPAEEWLGLGEFKMNAPVGAALLIALGALFLLDNLGVHVFREISRFWPVVLIAMGLILLQRRMAERDPPPPPGPGISGTSSGSSAAPKSSNPSNISGSQQP